MVRFQQWVARIKGIHNNRSLAFDMARIYLGIGLVVRGGLFVARPDALSSMIHTHGDWLLPMVIGHFVAGAHLVGGTLLTLGFATRLAAAVQVPILLGALLFVHSTDGLFAVGQSLELVGLVLVLLTLYSVFGAGRLSVDHYFAESELTQALPESEAPPVRAEPLPVRI